MSDDSNSSSSSSEASWSDSAASSGFDAGSSGGYGSDTYTEVTHVSWFERLKQAIAGVLIGLTMIVVSVGLLFWNEGRAVTTARSLSEGADLVKSVPADRVDPANQDKLVHVAGPLTLGGPVSDAEFGVTTQAVRLLRKVEMYQWKEKREEETRKKVGGGEEKIVTYRYTTEWSDRYEDSSKFKQGGGRHNPTMRFNSRDVTVEKATLGAFNLTPEILSRLGGSEALPVDASIEARARQTAGPMARVVDGRIYVGRDPGSPQVGDLRISYQVVKAAEVSIVARQSGNGFGRYQTRAGDELLLLEKGVVPAAQMFKHAQDANTTLTWILRAVGVVAMFIGFVLFFRPLGVVADVIPILGDIVRLGTGAIGFAMTAVLSTLTIAIAWLFYRPVLGVLLLVAGVGVVVGLKALGRKRRAARQGTMPAGMAPAAPGGYAMPPQAPMGQMPPGQWQQPQPQHGQWGQPQPPQGQWPQQPAPQGQWPQQGQQGQWQQPQQQQQRQPQHPPQGPVVR